MLILVRTDGEDGAAFIASELVTPPSVGALFLCRTQFPSDADGMYDEAQKDEVC